MGLQAAFPTFFPQESPHVVKGTTRYYETVPLLNSFLSLQSFTFCCSASSLAIFMRYFHELFLFMHPTRFPQPLLHSIGYSFSCLSGVFFFFIYNSKRNQYHHSFIRHTGKLRNNVPRSIFPHFSISEFQNQVT